MKKLFFTVLLSFMFFTIYGQTWDLEDYSSYKIAADYTSSYPANWSKAHLYPKFSWDKIPQHLTFKSGTTLTEEQYQKAAEYPLVDVNGADFGYATWDEGMWEACAKLKSIDSSVVTSFYLNLKIHFPWYLHSPEFELYDEWKARDGVGAYVKTRDYFTYNHDDPDFRQFWADVMLDGLDDPNVDFGFIDKTVSLPSPFYNASGVGNDGYAKSLDLLYNSLPEDKFLIGNTLRNHSDGGNRSAMQVYDGSYLERWHFPDAQTTQTEPEALAVTIQLAREALSKGKLIIFRNTDDAYNNSGELTTEGFYVPLAAFLIMVEENATISFQGSNRVGTEGSIWDTSELEYFTNYLGAPKGPPVKNGLVYTRSFDNLDVYLDLSAATLATCTATFTWGDKTGPGNVPATGVELTPDSVTVLMGRSKQLSAKVLPVSVSNTDVMWSSNDDKVATVSPNGLVTSIGVGTTFIKATTDDGGFQDSCVFTVSDAFVTGVDIVQESDSVNTGEILTLNASVIPSNAIIQSVTWSSSDNSIARVNSSGEVSVIYGGIAVITATSEDGGFTDSCIIKSLADPKPDLVISGYYQILKSNGQTVCLYAGEDESMQAGDVVTLFAYTRDDPRTIWEEIEHENGYYSYQRLNTNLCLDAGDGGAKNQTVVVAEFDLDNKNQQWEKIVAASGNITLKKRDVEFVLNGGGGAEVGKEITLWDDKVNGNLEWVFVPAFAEKNALTIIVTDSSSNQVLSDVKITLGNEVKQTSVAGEAIFSELYVSDNYTYTLTKDGYKTVTGNIQIDKDSILNLSMIFIPTASLTITVTDSSSNQVLSDVEITLDSETKQTGLSGETTFSGLDVPASYTYTLSKDGYTSISGNIEIVKDSAINISMISILSGFESNSAIDYSFYLSPNPAASELNIELKGFETAQMSILNSAGQTVINDQFNNRMNTVDVSVLPTGIYIVKLTNYKQTLIKKFMKK